MLITEFCKTYGVDKGEVDYWTRIGLLHPRVMKNGYRDYSGRAEDEVEMILVAKVVDSPGSFESNLESIRGMDNHQLRKLLTKMKDSDDIRSLNYKIAYNKIARMIEGTDL